MHLYIRGQKKWHTHSSLSFLCWTYAMRFCLSRSLASCIKRQNPTHKHKYKQKQKHAENQVVDWTANRQSRRCIQIVNVLQVADSWQIYQPWRRRDGLQEAVIDIYVSYLKVWHLVRAVARRQWSKLGVHRTLCCKSRYVHQSFWASFSYHYRSCVSIIATL